MKYIIILFILLSSVYSSCPCSSAISTTATNLNNYLKNTKQSNKIIKTYKKMTEVLDLQLDELKSAYIELKGNNMQGYKDSIAYPIEKMMNTTITTKDSKSFFEHIFQAMKAKKAVFNDLDPVLDTINRQ